MKHIVVCILVLFSLSSEGQVRNLDSLTSHTVLVSSTGRSYIWDSNGLQEILQKRKSVHTYDLSGEISYTKHLVDRIPSQGANFEIDISNVGFTNVISCTCTAERANASVSDQPIAVVDFFNTSVLKIKVLESNLGVVVIGGVIEGLENATTGVGTFINIDCKGN